MITKKIEDLDKIEITIQREIIETVLILSLR